MNEGWFQKFWLQNLFLSYWTKLNLQDSRLLDGVFFRSVARPFLDKNKAKFCSHFSMLLYNTTRFHVVVRLFSNRSQKTSKCGKNKKVAHEAQPSVSLSVASVIYY